MWGFERVISAVHACPSIWKGITENSCKVTTLSMRTGETPKSNLGEVHRYCRFRLVFNSARFHFGHFKGFDSASRRKLLFPMHWRPANNSVHSIRRGKVMKQSAELFGFELMDCRERLLVMCRNHEILIYYSNITLSKSNNKRFGIDLSLSILVLAHCRLS
jgi:hypothetical protein